MDHVAVLSKTGKWLEKILSGEKTIESRWYKFKKTPYGVIKAGDIIYFKTSGESVNVRVLVSGTLFFDKLNQEKIKDILENYGKQICIPKEYAAKLKNKNYCTLIFIGPVERIKPFQINKTGYGNMAAWISVRNINQIKRKA